MISTRRVFRRRWLNARLPVVPVVLTALVGFGGLVPCEPLRDAVTLGPVSGVGLRLSPLFVALTPVYGPMDIFECLTPIQNVVFLLTVFMLFAAWRLGRRRDPRRPRTSVGSETRVWMLFLAGLLAYGGAALELDRPMAALRVQDPDTVVVDFHSHTLRSHDGRPGFDAERNRAWHAAAGFHVAYVTDHHAWGRHGNPEKAGDGTVLLNGAELRLAHSYIIVLGDAARYAGIIDDRPRGLLPGRSVCFESAPSPAVIIPLPIAPEKIERVVEAARGTALALELHDGAPWGIEQLRRQHDSLRNLADELHLATVSGTNLHGWGRVAAAWTLLQIPGWRTMAPDRLGAEIELALRSNYPGVVRIVERTVADPGDSVSALALTGPLVTLHLLRTLQPLERVAWLVWAWASWLVIRFGPRRGHDRTPGLWSASLRICAGAGSILRGWSVRGPW